MLKTACERLLVSFILVAATVLLSKNNSEVLNFSFCLSWESKFHFLLAKIQCYKEVFLQGLKSLIQLGSKADKAGVQAGN